mmetsp:Transcript_11403/g.26742  ORF Transcript_11403/g.26742 Transcript_11403/m.26742 type:complete len:210 (-) Transcript_11403:19-648(-)
MLQQIHHLRQVGATQDSSLHFSSIRAYRNCRRTPAGPSPSCHLSPRPSLFSDGAPFGMVATTHRALFVLCLFFHPTTAIRTDSIRATIESQHLVDAYCVLNIAETKWTLLGWARVLFLVRSKSRLQSFLLQQDLVGLDFLVEHAELVDLGLFLLATASRHRQSGHLQRDHLAPQFPGLGRQPGGLKVRSFLDALISATPSLHAGWCLLR